MKEYMTIYVGGRVQSPVHHDPFSVQLNFTIPLRPLIALAMLLSPRARGSDATTMDQTLKLARKEGE